MYRAHRFRLDDQDRPRRYLLIEPAPQAEPQRRPIVLFFHGSQQSANVARAFTGHTFDALASRGALVVYLDGIHHHFNDARRDLDETTRHQRIDDVGFARRVVDQLIAENDGDPERVYACGFSNGGHLIFRMLLEAPGFLAGAAVFGATLPTEDNLVHELRGLRPAPTPLLLIHGRQDPISPIDGGEVGFAGRRRGLVRSALHTAEFFAAANGLDAADHSAWTDGVVGVDEWATPGRPPVVLWSVAGMGHVVASPQEQDARLGGQTDQFVAADVAGDFFGL
ncbi:alpha/beta hydrolase family esterase [Corynebacterium uterequi]|uniref:Poly(3-hydroxybutyrate) depolymerase n=1 Tax=Corynebacterium uterequi TaxID=1072256 RepID=A0A0G3HEQ9_9CORY|nr:PHB depolymerase family esterase [Corynebacterium uterequi]AKK11841.1 poly(3-hydroxybutyrate) depolymerase [Corynebacterium uterequi]